MKIFKKVKKGFTLVELVVVIAVIAILAAVSVGAYFGVTESANRSRLEQEAKQAYSNIQLVSLVDSNDSYDLDINGLHINDELSKFDKVLDDAGVDYELRDNSSSISQDKPTIIFSTERVQSQNVNKLYKQFDFYIPEISGMHANCDIINGGKITIVKADNPAYGESETPDIEEPIHQHTFNNNGPTCDDPTCDEPNPDYVAPNPVKGVVISEEEVTLTLLSNNTAYQVNHTLDLEDNSKETTDENISYVYESNNSDVASVNSEGVITAVSTGDTNIIVTVKVGETEVGSDTIHVIVDRVSVGVIITSTKTNFVVGEDENYTFTAEVTGTNLSDTSVTWSANGVDIDANGKVSFGTTPFASATVRATSNADNEKYAEVTIKLDKKADSISFTESNKHLNIGEEIDLAGIISTGDATINKEYTLSSNNDAVTVNGTKIKAENYVGAAVTITATLTSNTSVYSTLNVVINNPISSFVIKSSDQEVSNIELTLGNELTNSKELSAVVTYNGNLTPAYVWSVDTAYQNIIEISDKYNETIIVTAKAAGEAIIQCTVNVGGAKTATQVIVKVNEAPLGGETKEGWILLKDESTLKNGDKIVITSAEKNAVAGRQTSEYLVSVSCENFSSDRAIIDTLPSDSLVFTINNSDNGRTLARPDGNLLGASSDKALTFSNTCKNQLWLIDSFETGISTITNVNFTTSKIYYNNSSPCFKNYTSSQGDISIYKFGEYVFNEDDTSGTPPTQDPDTPSDMPITVSISDIASANNWSNGVQYKTFSINSKITITANGGGNTGKYYTSDNTWRLYESENATLKFEAIDNVIIKSVSIIFTGSGTKIGGVGSGVTISNNSSSLSLAATGKPAIKSITITYSN